MRKQQRQEKTLKQLVDEQLKKVLKRYGSGDIMVGYSVGLNDGVLLGIQWEREFQRKFAVEVFNIFGKSLNTLLEKKNK